MLQYSKKRIKRENSNLEVAMRQTEATAPEKEFSGNSIQQSLNSVKREFLDRYTDAYSKRSHLANSLETIAKTDAERKPQQVQTQGGYAKCRRGKIA